MKGRRTARVEHARLAVVRPIQGGTSGLINAIFSGRVDPLDPRPLEADRFVDRTPAEYRAARKREERRDRAQAKKRADRLPF